MKRFFLVIVAILTLINSYGQNRRTTVEVDYMEATSRYLEPTQAFMTIPVIADLQVSKDRITYTERDAFSSYIVSNEIIEQVPNFKQIALCRAARAHNADVILGATIDVITNEQGHFEITVTGYPATYVNFRNAKEADFELIRQGKTLYNENYVILDKPQNITEISEVEVKKSRKE